MAKPCPRPNPAFPLKLRLHCQLLPLDRNAWNVHTWEELRHVVAELPKTNNLVHVHLPGLRDNVGAAAHK